MSSKKASKEKKMSEKKVPEQNKPNLGEPQREVKKSFNDTAEQVIKDSIRSAICIDDNYASAYSNEEGLNIDEPKKLYESFREDGHCDLDIYQYKNFEESWKKEYMLSNKDLMILDWELDQTTSPKFKDTLKILKDVIKSNLIPFVVIYTNTENIDDVGKQLLTNFNFIDNSDDNEKLYEILNSNLLSISDESEIDFELFLDEYITTIYDYIKSGRSNEVEAIIITKLKEKLSIKERVNTKGIKKKISSSIKTFGYDNIDPLFFIGLFYLNEDKQEDYGTFQITKIESKNLAFKINNTTVLIYHKKDQGGINPELLFKEFSSAIISNPHNYLTLLSLELKDHLREVFSKIGSKFSSLNEMAFFYHLQNFKEGTSFNKIAIHDFIIESWMQDLNTNKLNGASKVINLIEEVYSTKESEIPKELDKSLSEELIRYSAYLSTRSWDENRKKIGFGDLFVDKEKDNYFLCITPHCDCVEPESKINNNFYFIKGSKANMEMAISNAEQGFYTFVDVDNDVFCLEWSTKPFTVYVEDNDIQNLSFYYGGKQINLRGLIVLKENFTQRLSNESFGYGYRVGINLPHKVKNDSPNGIASCTVC